MAEAKTWVRATRPKTLIASFSPVLMATSYLHLNHAIRLEIFLFTILCALGIQITTNLANDLFDFKKGADTEKRKGPLRVMQAGLVSEKEMKAALLLSSVFTTLCGLFLVIHGGAVISFLLSLSLVLAFFYTAGPFPLAYLGLGELFVLIFFGPIATGISAYLQTSIYDPEAFLLGLSPGFLSCAILIINNLRDQDEDRIANKKTVCVRFGKLFTKIEFSVFIIAAFANLLFFIPHHRWLFLPTLMIIPSILIIRKVWQKSTPYQLNALFPLMGLLMWAFTLLFILGTFL